MVEAAAAVVRQEVAEECKRMARAEMIKEQR
jgi:hypothetical protein